MAGIYTDECCAATEHVIDDPNNALVSISEPRWSEPDASREIKQLKRRVHDPLRPSLPVRSHGRNPGSVDEARASFAADPAGRTPWRTFP